MDKREGMREKGDESHGTRDKRQEKGDEKSEIRNERLSCVEGLLLRVAVCALRRGLRAAVAESSPES